MRAHLNMSTPAQVPVFEEASPSPGPRVDACNIDTPMHVAVKPIPATRQSMRKRNRNNNDPDPRVKRVLKRELDALLKKHKLFRADQTLHAEGHTVKGFHVRTSMPTCPSTEAELDDQIKLCRDAAPSLTFMLFDHLMLGAGNKRLKPAGTPKKLEDIKHTRLRKRKRACYCFVHSLAAMVHVGNQKRSVIARANTLMHYMGNTSGAVLRQLRYCGHVLSEKWISNFVSDVRKESDTASLMQNAYLSCGYDNFNWTSHWTGDRRDGQFWMRFVWSNSPACLEHLSTVRTGKMEDVTFENLYELTHDDFDKLSLFWSHACTCA